jgi:predicted PurR-regulated permease PerM
MEQEISVGVNPGKRTERGVANIDENLPGSDGRSGGVAHTSVRVQIDWHAIIAAAVALFLGLGLLRFLGLLAQPLAILILAIAIAGALTAPVKWLERRIPRLIAIVGVHIAILLLLMSFVALIIPPLAAQVQEISQLYPDALNWTNERLNAIGMRDFGALLASILPSIGAFGGRLIALPMAISDVLLTILVIFFLSMYGLMAAPALQTFIRSLVPMDYQDRVDHVLSEMIEDMGGYVRGVFITGSFVGMFTYIGLRFIGLPYPMVLGVFAGLMEAIPVLGTAISLLTITGIGFLNSVTSGIITFTFMAVLQMIEGNILFPNIVGRETNSSPLLSMFAFFAGMSVGGIIGGVIGVPLAAALRVLVVEVLAPAMRHWTGARPLTSDGNEPV